MCKVPKTQLSLFASARSLMRPADLTRFDWIVISSSSGKDSQAMLDWICELAALAGVLSRVVVVHADLGRVEWAGTKELAEAQAHRYGVRFEVVRKPGKDLLDRVEEKGMWPSPKQRWCTSDFKRGPIRTLYTRLAAESRAQGLKRRVRILSCLGMRAEESSTRAKLKPFSLNFGKIKKDGTRGNGASNSRRAVWDWHPLLDWKEAAVWARIRTSRTADLVHPCYAAGMPRCSCCFCVYAPFDALLRAAYMNPSLGRDYAAVEKRTGHRFKMNLAMADVIAAMDAGVQPKACAGWAM